jgi:hypothetical protein
MRSEQQLGELCLISGTLEKFVGDMPRDLCLTLFTTCGARLTLSMTPE